MSSLTKEQLRNELISHGVEPPQPSSKKEELLKLYNKHVLPAQNAAGEFSSDEEFIDHPNGATDENGTEDPALAGLSDREVRDKLLAYGVDVGPVVASTRRFLVKKLSALVKSSASAGAATGDSNGHTVDATDHAGAGAADVSGRPASNGGGAVAAAGSDEARDRFSCDSSEEEQDQELAASEAAVAEAVEAEVQSQHHRQQQLQLQRQQQQQLAEVRRRASAAATTTTTAATAAAATVIGKGGVSCHSPAPGGESVRAVYLRSSRDTPSPRRSLQDARGSFSASSSSSTAFSSQFASSAGHQRSFFKSLLGPGVASASAAGGVGVSGYHSTLSSREHGRYPYTACDKSSSSSTRGAGRIVSMTLFAVKLLLLLTAVAAAIFFGYHCLVLGESMTTTFQSVEQTAYDALEQYRGRVAGSVPAADTDTNTAGHQ